MASTFRPWHTLLRCENERILTHTSNAKCLVNIPLCWKRVLVEIIVPFKGYDRRSLKQALIALEVKISIYYTHLNQFNLNWKYLLNDRNLGILPFSNALDIEPQSRTTLLSKMTPKKSETNVEISQIHIKGA